ncbi:hypothetical protein CNA00075 [Cryptococcus deneoformans JEC21]|uniref:Uncharacterized protein n=1 Tax=Cryptococcus deneoformans (strain JEC21 / ATCC MYA-565) TaxID=214684 RepID=A0A0S2LHR2_CRYD1|nr:hypothetical protein CNA00075 [Cryptococcus neoformans var. neoformans JEC21]ALO60283.1 hypothetical protein CNA00075 [Cryptococcus neoformans var. neoformans JEC21]
MSGCYSTMLGAILTLNEWEQEEHIPKSWDHLENPPDVRFLSSRLDPAVFRRMTMPDTFIFAAQHVLSRHKDKFEGKWWDLWCVIHPLASEDDPTEHLVLPAGAPIDLQDLSSRFNLEGERLNAELLTMLTARNEATAVPTQLSETTQANLDSTLTDFTSSITTTEYNGEGAPSISRYSDQSILGSPPDLVQDSKKHAATSSVRQRRQPTFCS